jgi:hypothetical protein
MASPWVRCTATRQISSQGIDIRSMVSEGMSDLEPVRTITSDQTPSWWEISLRGQREVLRHSIRPAHYVQSPNTVAPMHAPLVLHARTCPINSMEYTSRVSGLRPISSLTCHPCLLTQVGWLLMADRSFRVPLYSSPWRNSPVRMQADSRHLSC